MRNSTFPCDFCAIFVIVHNGLQHLSAINSLAGTHVVKKAYACRLGSAPRRCKRRAQCQGVHIHERTVVSGATHAVLKVRDVVPRHRYTGCRSYRASGWLSAHACSASEMLYSSFLKAPKLPLHCCCSCAYRTQCFLRRIAVMHSRSCCNNDGSS